MIAKFPRISENQALFALVGAALLAGLLAFEAYGVSWDEPNMISLGQEAYRYVTGAGPYVEAVGRRFHGPIVELSLTVLQNIVPLGSVRDVFLLRHLVTYLFFAASLPLLYFLCKRVTADWRIALLGPLFLLLSPRMFAHAFVNSRDIPNLTFFVASMLALVRMMERPTPLRALVFGLASALTMMRLTGFFIPMVAVLLAVPYALAGGSIRERRRLILAGIIALCAWVPATFLFWPLLWEQPLANFLGAYRFMSGLGGSVFFFGATRTDPLLYFPVWIVVTTPLIYLALFAAGTARAVREFAARPLEFARRRPVVLLAFLSFFLPLATVMIRTLGLYDDWRHIYFVYPFLLVLSVYGCDGLLRSRRKITRQLTMAAVALSCLWTAVWMVRFHPHQIVYFSVPGSWVDGTMELDYWGLTYRRAFEWILERDPSPAVLIHPTSSPGYSTPFIMRPEQVQRIRLVEDTQATYIVDNFRRDQYIKKYPAELKIHSIMVGGVEVLAIYKMR